MKKTLVIGASTNETRYSNIATHRLLSYGHEVALLGTKKGEIEGLLIHNDRPNFEDIDTVTLYVNPKIQEDYYDYILDLKPKRIIFNPGTENASLVVLANKQGIETTYACTLVLLATGEY